MVFVPMLPALFYMTVLAVIFSMMTGFSVITPLELLILGVILTVGFLNDLFSGILGAKWGGASKKSIFYGFIGLVMGTILFPPLGGIVGLFAGILIAELLQGKANQNAIKAATGSVIGAAVGMIINLFLASAFFVLFLGFVVF